MKFENLLNLVPGHAERMAALRREKEQLKKQAEIRHAQLNYEINQSMQSESFTQEGLDALSQDPQQEILREQIDSAPTEEEAKAIWDGLSSPQQTDILKRHRARIEKGFDIPSVE